jgi:hypothetical protein
LLLAVTKPQGQVDPATPWISKAGRVFSGRVTGFVTPTGVAGQLGYDTAKGVVAGEVGGALNILLNF